MGKKAWLQFTEKEIKRFLKDVQSHSWNKKCKLKLQQDAVFHQGGKYKISVKLCLGEKWEIKLIIYCFVSYKLAQP